jgi:hypothetical protein
LDPIEWNLRSVKQEGEAPPKKQGGGHGVGAAVGEGGMSSAIDEREVQLPWRMWWCGWLSATRMHLLLGIEDRPEVVLLGGELELLDPVDDAKLCTTIPQNPSVLFFMVSELHV